MVEACVCARDAACCVFGWDGVCAENAQTACEATCMGVETEGAMVCDGPVYLELDADDAALSGSWETAVSQMGEGTVLFLPDPAVDGAVRFAPEIPCTDTYFVWVRFLDNGASDSFYVTLDEEPDPPGIFQGDCTNSGSSYIWRVLNRGEEGGAACRYVEDPWTTSWVPGAHAITFSFRDARALSRIVVTNDPAYSP
jgi:hypothetical protein